MFTCTVRLNCDPSSSLLPTWYRLVPSSIAVMPPYGVINARFATGRP